MFGVGMEGCSDFIEWLGPDMSVKILMCLENPSDLVRVSAVSSGWREFVIANGLCKQLCLRMFPELSSVAHVIEVNNMIEPLQVNRGENSDSMEWSCLEREHKVYAFLARGLASFVRKDCLDDAIVASSTDNYPEESIMNTLEPSDRVEQRASYWSSKGESNPEVSETLLYKLISNLCVVTEIHVQPFQAYFQFGFPIYSSKAVRFSMGYLVEDECDIEDEATAAEGFADDKVVWTYTSPPFPMLQENSLQKFKLPEPVLCIGRILKIELLGRVQRQEMDGLYYICVSHVQVVGRPLSPAFDVEIVDSSGKCMLKYYPGAVYCGSPAKSQEGEASNPSAFRSFTASIRGWEQMILNTLLGGGAVVIGDNDSDDEVHALGPP